MPACDYGQRQFAELASGSVQAVCGLAFAARYEVSVAVPGLTDLAVPVRRQGDRIGCVPAGTAVRICGKLESALAPDVAHGRVADDRA